MLTRKLDDALFASYSDDIPSFLKKIYSARGVSEAQLSLSLTGLLKPKFEQLGTALTLLEHALIEQKRILIVGDFDCDANANKSTPTCVPILRSKPTFSMVEPIKSRPSFLGIIYLPWSIRK
jgi:hypothetical protein